MSISDIPKQRKRELDERAKALAPFIPELLTDTAVSIHNRLLEKIGIEKIEPPCKKIMSICEDLPPGVALACLMIALTDHWTRMRELYELERHQ